MHMEEYFLFIVHTATPHENLLNFSVMHKVILMTGLGRGD